MPLTSEVPILDHSGLIWRKSSRSTGDDDASCIEVARLPHSSFIRDSKNPSAGTLSFPSAPFRTFLGVVSLTQ
jgi:hypothetical protein